MGGLFTQELSWRMGSADSTVELGKVLRDHLEEIGVSRFSYVGMYPASIKQRAFVDTNYPEEWSARYLSENYLYVDPMVGKARSTLLPFQWGPNHELHCENDRQRQVINESAEFNQYQGINVPIRGSNGEFAFLVAVTEKSSKEEFDSYFFEYSNDLHLTCLHYHHHLWQILGRMKLESLPEITPNQVAVLRLASMGKTAWEISEVLQLSEAGVKYHLREVAKKLGTYGVTATVTKAIALGYFSP